MIKFLVSRPWLCGLLLIAAFGFVGHMDYTDARMDECAAKGLDYEARFDRCVKPPKVRPDFATANSQAKGK